MLLVQVAVSSVSVVEATYFGKVFSTALTRSSGSVTCDQYGSIIW